MPVLRQVRARFERERPLDGVRVAASLHVTAETAEPRPHARRGRRARSRSAPPTRSPRRTTPPPRSSSATAPTCSPAPARTRTPTTRHIDAVLDRRPQLTIDDGADLPRCSTRAARGPDRRHHRRHRGDHHGVIRLRALEAGAGKLAFPVIAVTSPPPAPARPPLRNRPVHARRHPARHHVLLAGRRSWCLGYGACGRGVALRARGAGAHVIVCEVDPLRALEAVMDGYEVMPAVEAAAREATSSSPSPATGRLRREHFEPMHDGAIVATRATSTSRSTSRPRRAHGRAARAAPARRAARPGRRAPDQPARRRARREPRRRRGPPGRRDGRLLRRTRRSAASTSRATGPSSSRESTACRRRSTARWRAQARVAGRGDRRAERRPGALPQQLAPAPLSATLAPGGCPHTVLDRFR